eukprot:CAMPEP_0174232278 /NCGR_PEP_ID=MMETSP0417-20130205/2605_1 /TAXON_ID=242541 /ORGANISM="Mayorella sp, Strain BSH-02190019" /LENGTH=336 /DNA_ID=CAMNT_0015310297 /DNA_START=75 /DNA_END=1082 /DNA_ORIENTATION=+
MGCTGSSVADNETNDRINKELIEDRKRLDNEVKLLLLGAGESGKSTIAKQMKIIHLNGFTDQERETYASIIFQNCIGSMSALVQAAAELDIEISAENKAAAQRIVNLGDAEPMTPEIANDIKALWADEGIKETFDRSAEFQLNDSAAYYFENVERIAAEDYTPSELDLLRSRAKTTGIIETDFKVGDVQFRMVDVGGQRSERKKWMHCFQDVTAVIFCVAMSEYDLKLYEDDSTNRMHESLKLFKEICNNKWFEHTDMILFLNKKDVFEQKIQKVDLNVCFPTYTGGKNFEAASNYIREQFVSVVLNPSKQIYPHITCATDTGNVKHVFDAVKDII